MKVSADAPMIPTNVSPKKTDKPGESGKVEKMDRKAELEALANTVSGQVSRLGPHKSEPSSNVKLSDKAKEFQKIKEAALASAPDVRADKVAYFKELVASGKYDVNAEKVAEKLLEESIKNEVSSNQ